MVTEREVCPSLFERLRNIETEKVFRLKQKNKGYEIRSIFGKS